MAEFAFKNSVNSCSALALVSGSGGANSFVKYADHSDSGMSDAEKLHSSPVLTTFSQSIAEFVTTTGAIVLYFNAVQSKLLTEFLFYILTNIINYAGSWVVTIIPQPVQNLALLHALTRTGLFDQLYSTEPILTFFTGAAAFSAVIKA